MKEILVIGAGAAGIMATLAPASAAASVAMMPAAPAPMTSISFIGTPVYLYL